MALITNAAGTNIADVDTDNQLVATGPRLPGTAGFALLASEVDAGTVTGSRLALAVEASGDYRVRTGLDSFLLSERFPGTALNTSIWTAVVSTMAVTVSSGSVILNSGPITTASTSARVQSWRNFPVFGTAATYFECIAQFAQLPQANNVCEWGLGFATGSADPTDGVFFRLNTAGQFVCVASMGGTEVTSVPLSFATLIGINTTRDFIIELSDDYVNFWVGDVLVHRALRGAAAASVTLLQDLPVLLRTYNSGTTTFAQVMKVSNVFVGNGDMDLGKSLPQILVEAGGMICQAPTGQAVANTANYANSANPAANVPTNTSVAVTGLGGQIWETDTLGVNTDGILIGYQTPPNSATYSGRTLVITGVHIESFVQTILVGGGYVAQYALTVGATAVSMATADSATTKAPRRVPLGLQTVPAAAAALSLLQTIDAEFPVDKGALVLLPGEHLTIIKKKIGTAPSAGVIGHLFRFTGFWA